MVLAKPTHMHMLTYSCTRTHTDTEPTLLGSKPLPFMFTRSIAAFAAKSGAAPKPVCQEPAAGCVLFRTGTISCQKFHTQCKLYPLKTHLLPNFYYHSIHTQVRDDHMWRVHWFSFIFLL